MTDITLPPPFRVYQYRNEHDKLPMMGVAMDRPMLSLYTEEQVRAAIMADRQARAAAPAEPVAWLIHMPDGAKMATTVWDAAEKAYEYGDSLIEPLYAAPPRDEAWLQEAMRLVDSYAADYWVREAEMGKAARAALEAHLRGIK